MKGENKLDYELQFLLEFDILLNVMSILTSVHIVSLALPRCFICYGDLYVLVKSV